ncbi:hypothetical protein HCG51_05085 [Tolypothrix sp. PCC 7910]|uniref:hypothetical protein n=1 Tax=Tolypothrix sp. PCC 7910 TaxID=2099387 RepID=UPI0014277DA2|nr:hypothetical protein [Tolypothrix sp. PCC 7910]QIR36199.1 hypothetical protein HCG51_05085 [Tolypothrix sp. PCC 7910]
MGLQRWNLGMRSPSPSQQYKVRSLLDKMRSRFTTQKMRCLRQADAASTLFLLQTAIALRPK